MIEVRKTETFATWIQARIDRMETGNFGDVQPVGKGVNELRVHYGPGYRVYFVRRGTVVVVLLCGGDKKTQQADIFKAKELAGELGD